MHPEYAVGLEAAPAPSTARTGDRVLHEPPVPPDEIHPTVGHDLAAVCLKALAKEPGTRYASAGDMARDLESWRARGPVTARSYPLREQVVRALASQPRTFAAAILVTALPFGGIWASANHVHRVS